MKAIGVRAEPKGRTHGRYRPALRDRPESPCQRDPVHTWGPIKFLAASVMTVSMVSMSMVSAVMMAPMAVIAYVPVGSVSVGGNAEVQVMVTKEPMVAKPVVSKTNSADKAMLGDLQLPQRCSSAACRDGPQSQHAGWLEPRRSHGGSLLGPFLDVPRPCRKLHMARRYRSAACSLLIGDPPSRNYGPTFSEFGNSS
jgi:hypothetical protein